MKKSFNISTARRSQLIDITATVQDFVRQCEVSDGVCIVFVPHTTAGITINENADPSVKDDIVTKLTDLLPREDNYRHAEGNSDAHIKASLTGSSVTILIEKGRLILGTWQGIMFCEYDGPRQRHYIVKVQSD